MKRKGRKKIPESAKFFVGIVLLNTLYKNLDLLYFSNPPNEGLGLPVFPSFFVSIVCSFQASKHAPSFTSHSLTRTHTTLDRPEDVQPNQHTHASTSEIPTQVRRDFIEQPNNKVTSQHNTTQHNTKQNKTKLKTKNKKQKTKKICRRLYFLPPFSFAPSRMRTHSAIATSARVATSRFQVLGIHWRIYGPCKH